MQYLFILIDFNAESASTLTTQCSDLYSDLSELHNHWYIAAKLETSQQECQQPVWFWENNGYLSIYIVACHKKLTLLETTCNVDICLWIKQAQNCWFGAAGVIKSFDI